MGPQGSGRYGPNPVTRRGLLKWLGGLALAGASVGTYALAIEPGFLLRTQYYALTPPNWTPGLKLRLVLIADPHLGEPYMSLARWNRILDLANSLEGDLHSVAGRLCGNPSLHNRTHRRCRHGARRKETQITAGNLCHHRQP